MQTTQTFSAAIGALPAAETWETREKTLLGLTCKAGNGQWLTGADRAYILETAETCPWEAGLATYQARALWFRLTGEVLPDPECATSAERSPATMAAASSTRIALYPNPATDQVVVRCVSDASVAMPKRYQFVNALGVVVREGLLADEMTAVPLGDLPAGLYHCRILQDEQVLQTEKLSVIRR